MALVSGVDEELGFFCQLVRGALRVTRVGVLVTVEQIVGELAVVKAVPEELRFDETVAELADDRVGIGRDVGVLNAHERLGGGDHRLVRLVVGLLVLALFEQELGLKSVLMGFGLDSDLIHSPNEHFGVFNFMKGIETIPLFFKYYAEMTGK